MGRIGGNFEHSMKLWEGMSQDLNFNVMFSQRGVLTIAHSEHELREMSRRVHAIRLNGIDSEILNPKEIKTFVPIINTDQTIRYPVMGGFLQKRGGTARHDAVAWGYARAADDLGVDIIQNSEVTGIRRQGQKILGVETSRGFLKAKNNGGFVAVHSSIIAEMAGIRLPIASRPLQALVSEPIKPILDTVIMSNAVHMYISQSDKGEMVLVQVRQVQFTLNAALFQFQNICFLLQWNCFSLISPPCFVIGAELLISALTHLLSSQRRISRGCI